MIFPKYMHLSILMKLVCTNFEGLPTNNKVVSPIQPKPTRKPGVGFAYIGRSRAGLKGQGKSSEQPCALASSLFTDLSIW